ncbi:lectin-like domain-containing protein [Candidatus Enterococcus ikei]|uniref:MucBP domain-containing protein n=1 Tax=Candidatus Enterococcus ikei TaxID=2815326 RepID=A0ABS3GVC6_9ENTE|nr:MucBP domain-containing protein [Enterococcus sp. DIV0869a]MBO0439135.1 MucBP domain-containing protein [Enterococcus sp. DIV0869a]
MKKKSYVVILLAVSIFFFIKLNKIEASPALKDKSSESVIDNEINKTKSLLKAETDDSVPLGVPLTGIFKIPKDSNSYVSGNKVIITDKKSSQSGNVFSTEANKLDLSKSLEAEMYIRIDGNADGMTFVLHNDSKVVDTIYKKTEGAALNAYYDYSYGVEFIGQIKNSLAIEFDTYRNDNFDYGIDKNDDKGHVAVIFPDKMDDYRGEDSQKKVTSLVHHNVQYPTFKLGNGKWRKFAISWQPFDSNNKGTLTYELEGLSAQKIEVDKKVFGNVDKVFWGFTGSTGLYSEQAEVIFKEVPGLVNFTDSLKLTDSAGNELTETSAIKNDTELQVNYSGEYKGGNQNLLAPVLKFTLSDNQEYLADTLTVNGVSTTPNYADNILQVNLSELDSKDNKVDVSFKLKPTKGISLSKPTIKSSLTGLNYFKTKMNTVSYTLDTKAPTGIGKLTVVDQFDANKLTNAEDYKGFLKSWQDDVTAKEKVQVYLKEGQDIKKIVETAGVSNVILSLKDEAGNIGEVTIPLFIKEKETAIAQDDTFLMAAKDIKIYNSDYSETTDKLKALLRKESSLEMWQTNVDGSLEKLDSSLISIETDQLPQTGSIPDEGDFPVKLEYTEKNTTLNLAINLKIVANLSKVIVQYVDESGEAILDPTSIIENVGKSVNLTEQETVKKKIEEIINKNYLLVTRPSSETAISVTKEEQTVAYQFKGTLKMISSPNYLNFGRKTIKNFFIKVEQAKYDKPLIIWDNRKVKSSWTVTATLKKALTNTEDESMELPRAIKYKMDEDQSIVLLKDVARSIAVRKPNDSNEYNISEDWKNGQKGFQLEVTSREILKLGAYRGTILWQIGETP